MVGSTKTTAIGARSTDYSTGKTTGSARAGSIASTGGILSYNW